jgi:hypothetical protein
LVFAVFNTFFLFADEARQRAFLRQAAGAVSADGRLVVETFVPRPGRPCPVSQCMVIAHLSVVDATGPDPPAEPGPPSVAGIGGLGCLDGRPSSC